MRAVPRCHHTDFFEDCNRFHIATQSDEPYKMIPVLPGHLILAVAIATEVE